MVMYHTYSIQSPPKSHQQPCARPRILKLYLKYFHPRDFIISGLHMCLTRISDALPKLKSIYHAIFLFRLMLGWEERKRKVTRFNRFVFGIGELWVKLIIITANASVLNSS